MRLVDLKLIINADDFGYSPELTGEFCGDFNGV